MVEKVDMIPLKEAAEMLGCDAHTLSTTAREHPEWIGFPFLIVGNRMKIPREGLERWAKGEIPVWKEDKGCLH